MQIFFEKLSALGVLVSHCHVQSTIECSNAGGLAKRTRVQRDVVLFVEKTLLGLLPTTLASSYLESLTLLMPWSLQRRLWTISLVCLSAMNFSCRPLANNRDTAPIDIHRGTFWDHPLSPHTSNVLTAFPRNSNKSERFIVASRDLTVSFTLPWHNSWRCTAALVDDVLSLCFFGRVMFIALCGFVWDQFRWLVIGSSFSFFRMPSEWDTSVTTLIALGVAQVSRRHVVTSLAHHL